MKTLVQLVARTGLAVAMISSGLAGSAGTGSVPARHPAGPVRVADHCLVDDHGPFLGLGVSYFTALWRCRNDAVRLEQDLAFLARQGFNYYRMLSMVGYYPAWKGLEIAPVAFTNREGKKVEAWPDYWEQLGKLIDLAYDRHGLRAQITIFADAQLMPAREARLGHMRRLLDEVVKGREQKIMLLEVANEAWQNGFPGDDGVAQLREFAECLNNATRVPVAISSNHALDRGFERLYEKSAADLATWHFSRDRVENEGWAPVYDCWSFGERGGFPPVISNEPIGPGSSVDAEREPIKLVMAAAFAYTAKLPAYVFHCEAGVFDKTRFEDAPGIGAYAGLLRLLPSDLPNWQRHDGKEPAAPLIVFAGGQPGKYWPDVPSAGDGCVLNIGARKGARFVCVPIGIRAGGLEVEAREPVHLTARDPLTAKILKAARLEKGQRTRLPAGGGGLVVEGLAR